MNDQQDYNVTTTILLWADVFSSTVLFIVVTILFWIYHIYPSHKALYLKHKMAA
jgi:hypothetical protein